MEITIDTITGNGRVKEMRDGVPHSTGFVGGDVAQAEKLGITKHTDQVWTKKIKDGFAAKQAQ